MVLGPIQLMGKGIFSLGRFFFKFWWIFLTLFIVVSGLVSAINEGIEQEDLRIPFKFLGNTLISSDEGIYEVVQDLEFESQEKESLVEKLGYYAEFGWYLITNLWQHLWMMIFWFFLFFRLERFLMGNDSKSFRAFVLAILTMIGLQIIMRGIPFRGLYSLGKFIIGVF